MKALNLLLCVAVSVLITGCPDMFFGGSSMVLIVENKTNVDIYVDSVRFYGSVKAGQTARLGVGLDGSIDDTTFYCDLEFYALVDNRQGPLIKRLENTSSVVTLEEDHRDKYNCGDIVYKIIVTNNMLGITTNSVAQSVRSATETLYSFKGYVKKNDAGFAEGARVNLLGNDEITGSAFTSASNGLFTINDVPSGLYTLHISLENYDDSYVSVTVPSYNNLTYILVQGKYPAGSVHDESALIKKYSVSGVISLEEGGYAAGASIQPYKGSALYGSTVTANIGGSYTIYDVVKGSYTIRAALAGYNSLKIKNVTVNNENLTNQNGILVKTYSVGSRGPAGGWVVYAGSEYDYEYYGFYYIEIAPEDVSKEADGKAIFGSHRYPDDYLWGWWESIELTEYIMSEYEKSKSGDIIETGVAADYCVSYKLNGYNDWALPTEDVFWIIKDSGNYENYNFKLNEQYWCSNTSWWIFRTCLISLQNSKTGA